MHKQKKLADIGLIGLAPMGKALAYNFRECGYDVAVYNMSIIKTEELKRECENKDNDLEDYDVKNHKYNDVIEVHKDNDVEDNKDYLYLYQKITILLKIIKIMMLKITWIMMLKALLFTRII